MILGSMEFSVKKGDSVCIAPGTPHRLSNNGKEDLKLLCCCSPAYNHDDVFLL